MKITDYIKKELLLLDGGMGTCLQESGLCAGVRSEEWNLSNPDKVISVHKAYFDAGSNVVNTNTFGANSLFYDDKTLENIICAAFGNAKKAAELSSGKQEKYVALDIGPLGKLLKPFGELDFEDAVSVFAKTVKLGVKYGADLIFIETMNDAYETKAALLAAKENCDLPVFVSNAYGDDNRLLTGADAECMAALLEGMGADAIGANCSKGPEDLLTVAQKLVNAASVPVIFKPNAGIPEVVNGKTVFNVDKNEFAKSIVKAVNMGVRIIGGCCGTTPEYIAEVKKAVENIRPAEICEKENTVISSYRCSVDFNNSPVLIGERINPTGKKKLRAALIENDIDYIIGEALSQQNLGADVLDVNVGAPEINEEEVLPKTVYELQAVCGLPLQIDTSNTAAMEKALRLYNGKPLINSVNGKEESMKAVFPLAKKYGGVIIALTLDESGIPNTAEGRLKIAKKILKTADSYGITKKNIVFDPLVMSVSADKSAAKVTLQTVKLIKTELGCKTSLGISNVSFGLPQRDIINSNFFVSALNCGLDAAIMNPYSVSVMKAYYSFKALNGKDENFENYIGFCETLTETAVQTVKKSAEAQENRDNRSELVSAIISGKKESAANITKELLKTREPLEIINSDIIPALDSVGKTFETGKTFLPQLLMSAEAAKWAFSEIKCNSKSENSQKKETVIIATVKGDIHDLGKNIVKLLLENYGFDVIDLGKDVSPETVVEKAVETHCNFVGLSALMTTTVPAMEETIKCLRKSAPWCKIIVGGAVLTEEYARKIGADKYAKDAMETVRYVSGAV